MKTPAEHLVKLSLMVALLGAFGADTAAQDPVDKFQPQMDTAAVRTVEQARTMVRQKQLSPAVEQLSTVTTQHPDYYRGFYNLGLALAKAGRPDEALVALDKAAALKKEKGIEDLTLLPSIGWTQYLAGDYDDAAKSLEEALQQEGLSDGSRVKVLNNLGTVYKRLGAYDDARSVLQRSAATGSARAEANLKIIDATERMKVQFQRSVPFNLDFKPLREVAEDQAGAVAADGESGDG